MAKQADVVCHLVVLGAGPGGYTAAFRAADLGLDVVLIERYPRLGGVCLNVGCIPSKALLHAAEVIEEARHAASYGVSFGEARIDLDKLRAHKDKVVGTMNAGLASMAKQRKVRAVTGSARFVSANELEVDNEQGTQSLRFEQCIIAAGSQPVKLPGFPWQDPRVMDSTDALVLAVKATDPMVAANTARLCGVPEAENNTATPKSSAEPLPPTRNPS